MKKFLTVLLVIAVMFTFSFGSAFAAIEAGTAPDTISDGYFETLWANYVKADHAYENYLSAEKEVLAGMKAEAKAVYDAAMEDATEYVTDANGFEGIFTANTDEAKAFRLAVAAAQFAAHKDAALAKFATVPTYNYSAEEITDAVEDALEAIVVGKDFDGKSYKEAAEMLVAYYVGQIEDKDDFNADVTLIDYVNAFLQIDNIAATELYAMAYEVGTEVSLTGVYDLAYVYSAYETNADGVKYVDQDAVNAWSVESIAAGKQVNAATVAAQKAQNAAQYAAYIVGKDAAAQKDAAKWLKIADILAEEGVAVGNINDEEVLAKYVSRADYITSLEEYAAKYGAEKNADGELVRDAAVVKVELEKGIVAIATSTGTGKTAHDAACTNIYNAKSAVVADKLAFVKESAVKAAELFLADAEDDYFAAEFAKVEAKVAEYVAKIEAAKKVADIEDLIEAMQEKVDDIKTAAEVREQCTTGDLAATVNGLISYANEYVTYHNAISTPDNTADLDSTKLAARIVEMVGESGLRTKAEVKKLTAEATAVAQGLPTNAEVTAAKKAVKAAVEAIPTKVTVEDLALVQAAHDAQKAYAKLTTVDSTYTDEIAAAVAKLVSAYNTSFVKAAATVDAEDEAAVKALKSEINAVIKTLKALNGDRTYLNGLVSTLNGYLNDIREDAKDAVSDAIKAIPLNVTEADKDTVVKARELYDAYVAKYTDYTALYYQDDATMGNTDYYKGYAAADIAIGTLTAAETVLGLNTPDPAYSVEALKITARSTAAKGSITVKWTVVGDTSAVEGYEIWKSTKKNSGYKKAFTATKQSYKNTKGLKKGTRYYYKVRAIAYTADGTKVKSDWSNKAYRIAK